MWVYLLRCRNGALYCGQTANLATRLALHRAGRGARFVRMAGYGELAACWQVATRTDALKLEARIKRLSRAEKQCLVSHPGQLADLCDGITVCPAGVAHGPEP